MSFNFHDWNGVQRIDAVRLLPTGEQEISLGRTAYSEVRWVLPPIEYKVKPGDVLYLIYGLNEKGDFVPTAFRLNDTGPAMPNKRLFTHYHYSTPQGWWDVIHE